MFSFNTKHILLYFFQKLPSGPWARHVRLYHSITKYIISTQFFFSNIIIRNPSPPRHTCITCVSPKHIFTPGTGPATSDCITCVLQYHQNTFLLYLSKKSSSGPTMLYCITCISLYNKVFEGLPHNIVSQVYLMCITSVSQVYYMCITSILHMYHKCITLYHNCITCVSEITCVSKVYQKLYHMCIITVSHVYQKCITCVSKVYHQCIISVSSVSETVSQVYHMYVYHMCITSVS